MEKSGLASNPPALAGEDLLALHRVMFDRAEVLHVVQIGFDGLSTLGLMFLQPVDCFFHRIEITQGVKFFSRDNAQRGRS